VALLSYNPVPRLWSLSKPHIIVSVSGRVAFPRGGKLKPMEVDRHRSSGPPGGSDDGLRDHHLATVTATPIGRYAREAGGGWEAVVVGVVGR
jgi:hypothetical protein